MTRATVGKPKAGAGAGRGPRPTRRTQAERRAETRAALVASAVHCLEKFGYASTTTTMIAEHANVSRGAMTHHFPTKIELMKEVVQSVYRGDLAFYAAGQRGENPESMFYSLPYLAWEVFHRAGSTAVIEIMLATRSDPELRQELQRIQNEIDADGRARMVQLLQLAGHEPRDDFGAMHRLLVAALRGLALDQLLTDRAAEARRAVDLLVQLMHMLYPERGD